MKKNEVLQILLSKKSELNAKRIKYETCIKTPQTLGLIFCSAWLLSPLPMCLVFNVDMLEKPGAFILWLILTVLTIIGTFYEVKQQRYYKKIIEATTDDIENLEATIELIKNID